MFGAEEFNETARPTGLETLMQAAAQAPDPNRATGEPAQAVHTVTVVNEQTPAKSTGVGEASPDEEWPEANRLDHKRLDQARKIDSDHPPSNFKLNGFKPGNEKPRTQELWQAIMERDRKQRPKNWSFEKMVKFLVDTKNPKPATQQLLPNGEVDSAAQRNTDKEGAPAPEDPPPPPPAAEDGADSAKNVRWSRKRDGARLIFVCADDSLMQKFLSRDRKLNRQEMDAKGKDSFWHEAALLFNSDKVFQIPASAFGAQKYSTISGGPTPYVADAAKLKKEFGDLRADLTKILVNFRKSGQGDSAAQETRDQGEDEVHSSDFA